MAVVDVVAVAAVAVAAVAVFNFRVWYVFV